MSLAASEKDWVQSTEDNADVEGSVLFYDELIRILSKSVQDLRLNWRGSQKNPKGVSWTLGSLAQAAAPFLPDIHDEVFKHGVHCKEHTLAQVGERSFRRLIEPRRVATCTFPQLRMPWQLICAPLQHSWEPRPLCHLNPAR